MTPSIDFAKALLQVSNEHGIELTPLKLQKLAYYCQGYYLAINKKRLFPDDLEAWDHGPVVPALYEQYPGLDKTVITVPVDYNYKSLLSDAALGIICAVLLMFGTMTGFQLSEQTHTEAPWVNSYDAKNRVVIDEGDLMSYFQSEIEKNQDSHFSELIDRSEDKTTIAIPDNIKTGDEFYEWIQQL